MKNRIALTPNIISLMTLAVLLTAVSCLSPKGDMNVEKPEIPPAVRPLLTTAFVMGQYDPESDNNFIEIPGSMASRSGMFMHREAFDGYKRMCDSAKMDGIELRVVSATRNFKDQKSIWERKWTGATTLSDGTKATDLDNPAERASKILLYSSMPGTSRHHWGTDIDLNQLNNAWFESGEGRVLYEWLQAHAGRFGFCQPYQSKALGRTGYEEEKWHWSYVPISSYLTRYWADSLNNQAIGGFLGSDTAPVLDIVQNYVLGISSECILSQ